METTIGTSEEHGIDPPLNARCPELIAWRDRSWRRAWRGQCRSPANRDASANAAELLALLLLVFGVLSGNAAAPASDDAALAPVYFEQSIRPLFGNYCLKCHSAEKHKGDLDLERFRTLEEVRKQPKIWQGLIEQLGLGEMPPKDKPQPSPADKEKLMAWAQAVLDEIGRAHAGDPGPVVLRRLSNAEYTYTVRDLTGLESLDPAREFPIDGAAGEGFMNTGQSLVMSPALLAKYLDAGKDIARHVVLLPDGIRFSSKVTRRDWTEEILAQIRAFYREHTDPGSGTKVNLQGIVFDTNEGGRLPLEPYLAALLAERAAKIGGPTPSKAGTKTVENSATKASADHQSEPPALSPKYLQALREVLNGSEPSLLLDLIRARWRQAKPEDAPALAAEIGRWQKALWKFTSVGHIGKLGGPKAWQEPVNPIVAKQEVRLKITPPTDGKEITLYLAARDAGDGQENDFVIWQEPRLVAPGRPNVLLRDVRELSRVFAERRERVFASTAKCLAAAGEISSNSNPAEVAALAQRHDIEPDILGAWLEYLGLNSGGASKIDGYFTNTITNGGNYDFVKGWGKSETPNLVANSSDQHVRIPGNLKPHSIAVHPSPTLAAAVGWRSPESATVRIDARVTHAHPECGNGVTWSLELRRGNTRQRFASGTAQGSKEQVLGPFPNVTVQPGDLISILIGPRDGNHSCDLTAVSLTLTPDGAGAEDRKWDLAADVSGDILAGNPHADRFGHAGIWHFYTEPVSAAETAPIIPAGSLLARWRTAGDAQEQKRLAEETQKLLLTGPPAPPAKDHPDTILYRQLASVGGPLFGGLLKASSTAAGPSDRSSSQPADQRTAPKNAAAEWGLPANAFGIHPRGQAIDRASLCVQAPSILEVRLPAELVDGCEFVTTGVLDPVSGAEGSVQLEVSTNKPEGGHTLTPGTATVAPKDGMWTSHNNQVMHSAPMLVNEGSQARRRIEAAFDEFRRWFPAALCYTKIVPVDEVVTLTLYYREDDQLMRLMLDETQRKKLDRLWAELHYVSYDALALVDAFEQLWQYATQDADPKVFEPLRQPILDRAAAFRRLLTNTEPRHVQAIIDLAARAYRRPLTSAEQQDLGALYGKLHAETVPHDEAIRLMLARVLVAPAFLYKGETPGPGTGSGPVSDWELATRLSYFLWSSEPDAELREVAASGRLRQPDVLAAQARRMLRDDRVRRLAIEFACQWLHIRDFDTLDEKSERHFPAFLGLRGAIYEESIRFFTDLFQNDASILTVLDSDHTFLNEMLAKHYGIPGVTGDGWRRVDGVKQFGRGGILAQAATLAKQSGASRTSPILRGNWVAEALLGEKLPRPPKDVPRLPEDETATEGLTVRQLVEKHSSDPKCAGCHVRIDPYGFALEGFDAIGHRRDKDLGERPIDTRSKLLDGTPVDGLDGLRRYLSTQRRDTFVRQFSRKLLGYALGRSVQLSDGPLLNELKSNLNAHEYHFATAIETIVRSRQFREIRGKDAIDEHEVAAR